ncbi:hypothetical protein AAG906_026433 [Vitis piasezkii]
MAVSDEEEKIVEELVEQISKSELDALKIGNEEGDTPLHLAASIGNVQMCNSKPKHRSSWRPSAVRKMLFFSYMECVRALNGPITVGGMMVEISFTVTADLAFQIIHHYRDLVDSVDENGLTPLHLLASKPTAFRSGTPLSWFERIIYHCVYVEDLKEDELQQQSPQTSKRKKILEGPENYQTCMYFGDMIKTSEKKNTPILIAAKNGVKEMVEKILEVNPVAINDKNEEKKNVVLLAVENRQPEVYELLVKRKFRKDSVFRAVDNKGNSALHLAAMLSNYQPWHIPGAALQMQWEMKWYKYVKNSMPPHFFTHYNDKKRTPKEIFTEAHSELLKKGGKWLNSTSSSCSVVATLIATVAFATSATVPGSFNENNGKPNLAHQSAFNLFAVSSLIALCFSVTSLVMFLAILTSRHQEDDFHEELPRKLLFGLTALFISIAAMLVSFCAGHFFVLKDELKYAALPVYAVTCLPISLFAIAQFSLYFDLAWATFRKVPQRSYKMAF